MSYEEFRADYERKHPASIPVMPEEVSSEFPGWLQYLVGGMYICAALASGAHTVTTVYASIPTTMIAEIVRVFISILSFGAVDLALFAAAYARIKGNRTLVIFLVLFVFIVAAGANIRSNLEAFNAGADTFSVILAVVLGIGIPFIALTAGELFVQIYKSRGQAESAAMQKYRAECRAWDAHIARKYEGLEIPADSTRKTLPENSTHGNSSGKIVEISSARNPRGIAAEHFSTHPEDLNLKGAALIQLAHRLGISKSILYEIRAEIQAGEAGAEKDA